MHVEVPSGHQLLPSVRLDRAAWNFTFSYDVGLEAANPNLDGYEAWLYIDTDPSSDTDYLKLKLARLAATPAPAAGEPDTNGFGWKAGATVVIGDDEGTEDVTQNSQNLAFYDTVIDADPNTAGHQSYAAADYPEGQFDVRMILSKKFGPRVDDLHVVFDVVDP